jgi:DNA polymerase-3 subunit alpha
VIRYGLGAVKGTGQQAIEAIVRRARGRWPVPQPVRLLRAGGPHALNKRTVEALIKAGAFDSLQLNRACAGGIGIDRRLIFANASRRQCQSGGVFDMGDTMITAPARKSRTWWRPRPGA